MAKQTILKERGTNEVMYPQTLARFVRTDGGDNMEEALSKAKLALFDDMFRTAAGICGDIDHSHIEDGVSKPYYLNKIWLTYEEAMLVYIHTAGRNGQASDVTKEARFSFGGSDIITNLPITYNLNTSFERAFFGCRKIKVIRLYADNGFAHPISLYQAFNLCGSLENILGNFVSSNMAIGAFNGCHSLKEFRMYDLKTDLDLRDSPLLSYDTFDCMITNARNTEAITITVHPDVYSKLIDETNAEWHSLIGRGAEKNITFATT